MKMGDNETRGCANSPLVVGFVAGAAIGVIVVLVSMIFFMEYVVDMLLLLMIAAMLGGMTGGISAPLTVPFLHDMDRKKVLMCLAAATLLAGIAPSVVLWLRNESVFPILNWPSGIIGYWIAFVFRKELVWLLERLYPQRIWTAMENPEPDERKNIKENGPQDESLNLQP